jgi:DNA-binding SARP family transcriptional activator/tetratricopeptide (TPR) repeat protein
MLCMSARLTNLITSVPLGPGLRIGVLGPMLITQAGTEVRALAAGQRTVLGLLALSHGSPVRRQSIIDALWRDEPPASAAGIVQTYISRLRSVLDPAGAGGGVHLPASDGAGYRLQATADELDLLEFRWLVDSARRAGAAGDADRACRTYERAVTLWRGDPLADIDALRGHPAVVALADELAAAVLEYADAAASTTDGWHDRVLPQLRVLAARDPLHEASHARLMTALASVGRQAEALREYHELRRRLDEQLGVRPGLAVREAYAQILRQEAPARAGREAAGVRSAPVFQLPAALADFTGREADCQRIIGAVSASDHPGVPLIAISGPPGAGKTTMALYAAHKLRDRFPDGQLWVELAGASARPRSAGEVLGELLRGLGVDGSGIPDGDAERAVYYRSRLAGRRMLVVVDDAAGAGLVRLVTPGTAGCALIVTSRTRLEGLDGAHLVPLEAMTADDAIGLLGRIIGPRRIGAEPDAARELVRACGALPLALRIVGAKLATRPSWPVSVMAQRITQGNSLIRELEAGDLSVRASIASSYDSLPERPRRAFRLLALLGPSDFAGWVVGALLGDAGADRETDVVGDLTNRSLLTPLGVDATGEPRYRMHDLLREYASVRLAEESAADQAEALERLLAGWLQLAQLADSQLPPEPFFPPPAPQPPPTLIPAQVADRLTANPIAWFTSERINLLAAAGQARDIGRPDLTRQLAAHQCAFQHLQDRHDDTEQLWRIVADSAGQSGDAAAAAFARLRICASIVERGRSAEALDGLNQCVEELSEAGELEAGALAFSLRGFCGLDLDDFALARRDAEAGIALAQRAGSTLAEFINCGMLSRALACLGLADEAMEQSERALAMAVGLGAPTYELTALHTLAFTCTLTGRFDRAVPVCLRRIEISRKLGRSCGEALALGVLGDAYAGLGRYQEAADSLLQALPIFRDHGVARLHGVCLLKLGMAYEALGRFPEAIGYLEEGQVIFQQLRVPRKAELARQALDRCRAAALSEGNR